MYTAKLTSKSLYIINDRKNNLCSIMEEKLDNYEQDIDDNFYNQESIRNAKILIEELKDSAIKHRKTNQKVQILD